MSDVRTTNTAITYDSEAHARASLGGDTDTVIVDAGRDQFRRTTLNNVVDGRVPPNRLVLIDENASDALLLAGNAGGARLLAIEDDPSRADLMRAAAHDNLLPCAALGALLDYRCIAGDLPLLRKIKRRKQRRSNDDDDDDDDEPAGDDLLAMAAADDAELAAPDNEYGDWDDVVERDDSTEMVVDEDSNDEDRTLGVIGGEAPSMYALDRRNPIPAFDSILKLDESTHTYSLCGVVVANASTTSFIHSFFSEFDSRSAVRAMVNGKRWKARTHDHYAAGMSAVMDAWTRSSECSDAKSLELTRVMEFLSGARTRESFEDLSEINPFYRRVLVLHDESLHTHFADAWEKNRDEASQLGTDMHHTIELFYRGVVSRQNIEQIIAAENKRELAHFLRFHDDHIVGADNDPADPSTWRYEPFRMELLAYDPLLRLCGAMDGIFRNRQTGALRDWDWKRSKEIKMRGFDNARGAEPLAHLPDANFYHYSLQQNFYARYVREYAAPLHFGDGMGLAVFHPNNDSYKVYEVATMHAEVSALVECRRREIAARPSTYIERLVYSLTTSTQWFGALDCAAQACIVHALYDTQRGADAVNAALSHVRVCASAPLANLTVSCACREPLRYVIE